MNDFFASIYEKFYYNQQFSSKLYAQDAYAVMGVSLFLIALTFVVLYYYIINHPSFNRWQHWLVILIVNFIINFLFGYFYAESIMETLGYTFDWTAYVGFGLLQASLATVLFIAYSYLLRAWSSNCATSPTRRVF